jgi:phenylpropionate dioxygenase-like ring-hydroxylating dioxygenase large terminal subunit
LIPLREHINKTNQWVFRYVDTQVRRLLGDEEFFAGGDADLLEGTIVPDQWYAILEADKVGQKPVGLRRLGENLVLWRDAQGVIRCAPDRCPHRGSKLSIGDVVNGDLECPYHGFRFDGGGACTLMPALGEGVRVPAGMRLRPRPVQEAHGLIWMWWGAAREVYPEIPWFPQSSAAEARSASRSGVWKFHYSRAIENSLDLHHFPFVHGALNPRTGTYVDPFEAHEDDTGDIHVRGGLKQSLDVPDSEAVMFSMHFKFPGVMHVRLASKVHLTQICTPIDDERTWMYVRYYQSVVTLPLAGPILTRGMLLFDWFVAQEMQDIPIFLTQQPKVPGMDAYRMIKPDQGIIMYFRRRDALIAAAGNEPPELRPRRAGAGQ